MLQKLLAAQGLTLLCPPYMPLQCVVTSGKPCPLCVEEGRGEYWADWGCWPGTCIIAQEGPSGGDRDPLPDTDGLGVARISTLRLLIEAPVPVTKSTRLWACLGLESIPNWQ